jgi:hypothetical protein
LCDVAGYVTTYLHTECAVVMSILINLRKDEYRITTKDSNRSLDRGRPLFYAVITIAPGEEPLVFVWNVGSALYLL